MIFMGILGLFCIRLCQEQACNQGYLQLASQVPTAQAHPPTHRIILSRLLMIFMIFKIRQITSLVTVTVTIRVWLDRGSVLSLAIASISLNFCPTFRFFLSSH